MPNEKRGAANISIAAPIPCGLSAWGYSRTSVIKRPNNHSGLCSVEKRTSWHRLIRSRIGPGWMYMPMP